MTAPVLEVEGLTKNYGPKQRPTVVALRNVSFSLKEGEILALVGESGSGKSTIAKILNGVEMATHGLVRLEGDPIETVSRQAVQLVFQDPYGALNPLSSVEYVISRPLVNFSKLSGNALTTTIENLMEQVKLTPPELFLPKLPHELSGGQRQRVLIARALACRPQIIVADEPVSMLDVSIRAEILGLLNELRALTSVRAIIYITHDMASARMIADRVIVLYRGKIVESGTIRAVFEHPAHPYTQLLLRVIPRVDATWPELTDEKPAWMTSPIHQGCPFISRCPVALPVCQSQDPDLIEIGDHTQQVACHAQRQGSTT